MGEPFFHTSVFWVSLYNEVNFRFALLYKVTVNAKAE